MYDAATDPYCYPNSSVLKNIPGLRSQAELDLFEAASTMQRADEPIPNGHLSAFHYLAIHHHLFQDVYPFAGKSARFVYRRPEAHFAIPSTSTARSGRCSSV